MDARAPSNFSMPKRYRVTFKDDSIYTGYIAPSCIVDGLDTKTMKHDRHVEFALYVDEPHINNVLCSAYGKQYYGTKQISITDERIKKIEELDHQEVDMTLEVILEGAMIVFAFLIGITAIYASK